MITLLSLVAFFAGTLAPQGGMDMAVAQKWGAAKVVKYRAEGVHKGRVAVVLGDHEGKADVLDKVTVDFTWDNQTSKIIGPVTITDSKSEVTNIKSEGTNCPPPTLKGDYEQFTTVSHTINGDQLQITGTTIYPAAMVSNYPASCSMTAIPGGKEQATLFTAGVSPTALGMPIMASSPIKISADRTSFSMPGTGSWVWTLTPTLVK